MGLRRSRHPHILPHAHQAASNTQPTMKTITGLARRPESAPAVLRTQQHILAVLRPGGAAKVGWPGWSLSHNEPAPPLADDLEAAAVGLRPADLRLVYDEPELRPGPGDGKWAGRRGWRDRHDILGPPADHANPPSERGTRLTRCTGTHAVGDIGVEAEPVGFGDVEHAWAAPATHSRSRAVRLWPPGRCRPRRAARVQWRPQLRGPVVLVDNETVAGSGQPVWCEAGRGQCTAWYICCR